MIVIDPGSAGGIVNSDGNSVRTTPMPPTDQGIIDELNFGLSEAEMIGENPPLCYLEDLVKYAGRNMPSSSMAVYASNWGIIKGMARALGYRVVLVPPKKWQKALGLGSATGMKKTEWKNKLKQRAEELYPQVKVTLALADALLMFEAAKKGLI
jgi:hypothetical protein